MLAQMHSYKSLESQVITKSRYQLFFCIGFLVLVRSIALAHSTHTTKVK